jgi:hypothetical protein
VLGRLAADERGAGELATRRDAAHDVGDALGEHLAARDVVGHEERLRAHHDDVVDDHADEVLADRVVLVDRLRDRDLRADAVGRGGEQRLAVAEQRARVEEAREAADAAEHLGAVGAPDGRLHQFDGEISRRGVDAGFGIGILWGMGHATAYRGRTARIARAPGTSAHPVVRQRRHAHTAPGALAASLGWRHGSGGTVVGRARGRGAARARRAVPATGTRNPPPGGAAAPRGIPRSTSDAYVDASALERQWRVLWDMTVEPQAHPSPSPRTRGRLRLVALPTEGFAELQAAIAPFGADAVAYSRDAIERYRQSVGTERRTARTRVRSPSTSARAAAGALVRAERADPAVDAARRLVDRRADDRRDRRSPARCRAFDAAIAPIIADIA